MIEYIVNLIRNEPLQFICIIAILAMCITKIITELKTQHSIKIYMQVQKKIQEIEEIKIKHLEDPFKEYKENEE